MKVMNLIKEPLKKSCGSYVPGSFAEGSQIDQDLADEIALGPMLNILVNKENKIDKEKNLLDSQWFLEGR